LRGGGGAERLKQLSTEPDRGLGLTTPRSRPEPKPRVGCSTDFTTQMPLKENIDKMYFIRIRNLLL